MGCDLALLKSYKAGSLQSPHLLLRSYTILTIRYRDFFAFIQYILAFFSAKNHRFVKILRGWGFILWLLPSIHSKHQKQFLGLFQIAIGLFLDLLSSRVVLFSFHPSYLLPFLFFAKVADSTFQ